MRRRREFLTGVGGFVACAGAAKGSVAAPDGRRTTLKDRALYRGTVLDPTYIDERFDCRSINFENPTGGRGAGGKEGRGRKGSPSRVVQPGERIILANIFGPGTVRHIWMTFKLGPPEIVRALRLEVFYDTLAEPSISVPVLDFFGLPHGRPTEYYSAMMSASEGRGFNSYLPMPFNRGMRVELTNESSQPVIFYYQIDYTLEPAVNSSFLHVTFRRENPTTLARDFVVTEGLKGPGRFLGCAVGVRILDMLGWYGEGEVKIYRDGDQEFPTYCGTGLEDYVGSGWNLGKHYGPYAGAPINIPLDADAHRGVPPQFSSFYRWHLADPIMFAREFRVTIQQIGWVGFSKGQEAEFESYRAQRGETSVRGWETDAVNSRIGYGLVERADDYCATAYVYCERVQPVVRYQTDFAIRDVGLLPGESSAS